MLPRRAVGKLRFLLFLRCSQGFLHERHVLSCLSSSAFRCWCFTSCSPLRSGAAWEAERSSTATLFLRFCLPAGCRMRAHLGRLDQLRYYREELWYCRQAMFGCSCNVAPDRKLRVSDGAASLTMLCRISGIGGPAVGRRGKTSHGLHSQALAAFSSSPASCVLVRPSLRVGAKSLQSTAATTFDGWGARGPLWSL